MAGRGSAASIEERRWFAIVGALLPNIDEASPGLPGRPRLCGREFSPELVSSQACEALHRDAPYGARCFLMYQHMQFVVTTVLVVLMHLMVHGAF